MALIGPKQRESDHKRPQSPTVEARRRSGSKLRVIDGIIGNFVNVTGLHSQHEVIKVVNQVTRKDMLTSEVRSLKRAVEGTTKETRPW
jgi:hypothetical protein